MFAAVCGSGCRAAAWFVMCSIAGACTLLAHGDLHERIEQVTAQIQQTPGKAELYLQRGELRRLHEEWEAAEADYAEAIKLAPQIHAVHLGRGLLFLARNRFDEARAELDQYLERHPQHVAALVARARALARQKQFRVAAEDYTRALKASPQPDPEHYIERARALAAADPPEVDVALQGLDEGVAKLGPIVTLGLCAVELELSRKHFDSALKRLEKLSARMPRKETWLERRGDILKAAGRSEEAREAYRAALEAIEFLPPHVRQTTAMLNLENRVRQKLSE